VFFDVHDLEKRPIRFDQVFAPGSIELLDEGVRQVGDLRAAGVVEMIDPFGAREIRMRGQVEGVMEVPCARCLAATRFAVSGRLDLFYRPMAEIARDEEVAINEAETEVGFYEDPGVELADVVREQIMIGLPMRNICRPDCQGICPLCGTNRNLEACQCREEFSDSRWESLRNLRT